MLPTPQTPPNNKKKKQNIKRPLFILTQPINIKQQRQFLRPNQYPDTLIPATFIAPLQPVTLREAIEIAKKEAIREAIQEAYTREREALKPEKRRQYSPRKTRDPFRGIMEKALAEIDFTAKYWFCYTIVSFISGIIGEPKLLPERTKFDNKKIVALLLTKFFSTEYIGYRKLVSEAIKHGLDLTKNGNGDVPKKSYLNNLARSIGKDWFDKAIFLVAILIDFLVIHFFEADIRLFFADWTEKEAVWYRKGMYGGKPRLVRDSYPVTIIANVATNVVYWCSAGIHRDVSRGISRLPPNSTLLMDSAFDCEANFEVSYFRGIDVHVAPSYRVVRWGVFRRVYRRRFCRGRYRRRKIGEKLFSWVFGRGRVWFWRRYWDRYVYLFCLGGNIRVLLWWSVRMGLFAKVYMRSRARQVQMSPKQKK